MKLQLQVLTFLEDTKLLNWESRSIFLKRILVTLSLEVHAPIINMIASIFVCFGKLLDLMFWGLQWHLHFQSPAELILQSCNSPWKTLCEDNYITELQEKLILHMSNGILCEQGKNRSVQPLSETLHNEMHASKRDRKLQAHRVQGMVSSRAKSERDQNKIQICIVWGHQESRQGRCQYTPGFSLLECQMSWNTSKARCTHEKWDWHEFRQ